MNIGTQYFLFKFKFSVIYGFIDEKINLPINVVLGDEWIAGNLSYHLKSRPVWEGSLNNEKSFSLKKFKHYI